jgi:hypothetical protein
MNTGIIRRLDLGRKQNHWLNPVATVDFAIQDCIFMLLKISTNRCELQGSGVQIQMELI